ncbi:hypothetical protein PFLUOLIPICF7_01670 [Pseudomonas simiae]|uniref:Uncharacterized protein n=1 Tax=Pseudomonas simiae TaxID=321846 RepID=U1SX96_9PSED|nr:hypothetical protein PFLUOLIPICF7_01670 [Pseudomonas simiae]ERH56495.1 hypothetical protein O204_04515 [Pseudomonas simiae]
MTLNLHLSALENIKKVADIVPALVGFVNPSALNQ